MEENRLWQQARVVWFEEFFLYGSIWVLYIRQWSKGCLTCETYSKSKVLSLENKALNVLAQLEHTSSLNLPFYAHNQLIRAALVKDYPIESLLKHWPFQFLSLYNILSDHNFQCFSPYRRQMFAENLLQTFLHLILSSEECLVRVLDIRGVVLTLGGIEKFLTLIANVQSHYKGVTRQIFFDLSAYLADNFDDRKLFYMLSDSPESKLKIHLGHYIPPFAESRKYYFDKERNTEALKAIEIDLKRIAAITTTKLQSIHFKYTLRNASLVKMVTVLKSERYQNLVAVSFSVCKINFVSCPASVCLLSQWIADLPHLQILDLSWNRLSNCLKDLLSNLQRGLILLRLCHCKLSSSDLVYLTESLHSKTILALDISENFTEEEVDLSGFIAAFQSQIVGIEALHVKIAQDKVAELAASLQGCSSLYSLALDCSGLDVNKIKQMIRRLCLSKSLKIATFEVTIPGYHETSNRDSVYDNYIRQFENIIKEHEGNFGIKFFPE
ncbi:uncharacterized protein LOC136031419 isoform X2 [Artemia franciscana]